MDFETSRSNHHTSQVEVSIINQSRLPFCNRLCTYNCVSMHVYPVVCHITLCVPACRFQAGDTTVSTQSVTRQTFNGPQTYNVQYLVTPAVQVGTTVWDNAWGPHGCHMHHICTCHMHQYYIICMSHACHMHHILHHMYVTCMLHASHITSHATSHACCMHEAYSVWCQCTSACPCPVVCSARQECTSIAPACLVWSWRTKEGLLRQAATGRRG